MAKFKTQVTGVHSAAQSHYSRMPT